MTKVAVFGAGSWGTAFATVLADAGNQVSVWGRRESLCEAINTEHENPDYLPGLRLPDAITATHDPAAAADGAEADRARRAVPVAAGEPRATGPAYCRPPHRWSA